MFVSCVVDLLLLLCATGRARNVCSFFFGYREPKVLIERANRSAE